MHKNKTPVVSYFEWCMNLHHKPSNEFLKWISVIEEKIQSKYGFTLIDLPDEDYIVYFESKYSTDAMIQKILKSNGFN
jgi:uncharacterized membrane protein